MSSTILVIVGSTRDGRFGLRVGKMMVKALEKRQSLKPILIDPLDYEAPVGKHPLGPRDTEVLPSKLQPLDGMVKSCSGLVLVTAEYNATIAPAMSNLLDYFEPASYKHKPVHVVTYSLGSFGGIRARSAILPMCQELGMVCLPSGITIPQVATANIDEEGKCENNDRLTPKVEELAKEMEWYVRALEDHKIKSPL